MPGLVHHLHDPVEACLLYTSVTKEGEEVKQYNLPVSAHVVVKDNAKIKAGDIPVSYTHLDVYKRQSLLRRIRYRAYRRVSSMPFLGLKTGSAEQELCPLCGNGCSRGELRLQTGALAG